MRNHLADQSHPHDQCWVIGPDHIEQFRIFRSNSGVAVLEMLQSGPKLPMTPQPLHTAPCAAVIFIMSQACCARDGSERKYCARVCSTIESCAHARPRHRHSRTCHAYLCFTGAFCTSCRLLQRPASAASAATGFTTHQSTAAVAGLRNAHSRCSRRSQYVTNANSAHGERPADYTIAAPTLHSPDHTSHIRPATAKHQKRPKSNHATLI